MTSHIEALISRILTSSLDEADAYRCVKIANAPTVPNGISYVTSPEVRFTDDGRVRTAKFRCNDPLDHAQIHTLEVVVAVECPAKKDSLDRFLCGR
ncbi:MAG: hypothetical protein KBD29_00795 [Candidatus Magasanikbacteria bacterium]|nr:hypothetical protein [Candidatus Magasanikbacteria bacterium]